MACYHSKYGKCLERINTENTGILHERLSIYSNFEKCFYEKALPMCIHIKNDVTTKNTHKTVFVKFIIRYIEGI